MKTYILNGQSLKANYSVDRGDLIQFTGCQEKSILVWKEDYRATHKVNISFNGVDYNEEFICLFTIHYKTGRYSVKYIHPATGFSCGDSHKKVVSYLAQIGVIK